MEDEKLFSVEFDNIGLINTRLYFRKNYDFVLSSKFKEYIEQRKREPVKVHNIKYFGSPNELITLLLQRDILGLESYVPTAVFIVLGNKDKLEHNMKYIDNPYRLNGRGTVDNYFNKLPSLISKECSLKNYDKELWNLTKKFYRNVRNPIFHGNKFSKDDCNYKIIREYYKIIDSIYKWTYSWYALYI